LERAAHKSSPRQRAARSKVLVMTSVSYAHGSSSVGRALFHMCFVPKYRRKVFRHEQIKRLCEESFKQTAQLYGMQIEELAFNIDHVHMKIRISHTLSLADAARLLKGRAAHFIFLRASWVRKYYFWGGHFWGAQYFFDSVGANEETITRYIRNQAQ